MWGNATVAMAVNSDGDSTSEEHKAYKEPPPRTDGRVVAFKMPTFTVFDGTFMAFSMVTFVVDIGTDLNLVVRYFLAGSLIWAALTLMLVIFPAIIVMILSMRWHLADGHRVTKVYWAAHVTLWGILHRYILMFKTGVKARRSQDLADYDNLYRQQSDVCMLRMFESFMESAPQLVLQLYIMMSFLEYTAWTALTAFTSMVSLAWGIAAYTKAMRNARLDKHKMTISGLTLQTFWRIGMIAARVASLALVATVLKGWLLLVMGAHMIAMFLWVVRQKTGISAVKWEENLFNFIMAVTYCFCFFNLKEGHSRWRMIAFYVVIIIENSAFVITYFFLGHHDVWLKYTALGIVFGGMTVGLMCLILYYRFFHPMGPLNPFEKWTKHTQADAEKGERLKDGQEIHSKKCSETKQVCVYRASIRRNIKSLYPQEPRSPACILSAPGISLNSSPASEATESKSSLHLNYNKPSEVMCSVQDLLANVSNMSELNVSASAETVQDTSGVNNLPVVSQEEMNGPSSFEQSMTRELNIRLSSSDFKAPLLLEEATVPCDGTDTLDTPRSVASQSSSQSAACQGISTHSSPNSIGVPHIAGTTNHNSLRKELSTSILRTSIRKNNRATVSDSDMKLNSLPHLTTSTVDVTSRSYQEPVLDTMENSSAVKPPNVELAVIDKMHIIEVESSGLSSENQSDYENVYENQSDTKRDLPPKPPNLLVDNLDETRTTHSSIPHDYENICAVNINRAMWGVRHWKTYSDIEDRIHDNSTVKERLKLLDSTLASSQCSDYSILKIAQGRRSISMMEDSDSVLSRSLPDLSAVRLETCFEDPEEEVEEKVCAEDDNRLMSMLNQLRANRPFNKSNSVDDIPNYETIWVGDIEKPENSDASSQMNSLNSKSSLVVTIGDVRAKESLCNLYYSTMSDLSFRYYSERMRNNCSGLSHASRRSNRESTKEMVRAISVPDSKTLLEVSEMIEEQKQLEQEKVTVEGEVRPENQDRLFVQATDTPLGTGEQSRPRRKFSMLRERFESPWTPKKSPMKQGQLAQRRNSFQDRTAKALQAGMKVFRRPRVHVITPKKGDDKDTPRLKSPFRSKNTTPTPPAIKINCDHHVDSKIDKKTDEAVKLPSHVTPQRRGMVDHKLTKSTPKTSTPDNTKQSAKKTPINALDTNKAKALKDGPKTSTPEGNKQVQMSILSSVSSVVPSPPEGLQKLEVLDQRRLPLSENLHFESTSKSSCSQGVQESTSNGAVPKRPMCGTLMPAKSAVNLRVSRVVTEENVQNIAGVISNSGMQASQSLLSLQALKTSSQSQAMFTGFLGLPQVQRETKSTINIVESICSPTRHGNVTVSRSIILSSPQSPKFNMQKSTLSPNSKIFSRRI
ncbi:uncharacterized protein LOC135214407 [Macrobrachium nipponense]|uniref:uncharacterized protein LOC135214407 n=1 Tax=Macrobrachium nipponense TaxID=159736 RepID=UPI0030C7E40F